MLGPGPKSDARSAYKSSFARLFCSANQRAGPPIWKVGVRGASGTAPRNGHFFASQGISIRTVFAKHIHCETGIDPLQSRRVSKERAMYPEFLVIPDAREELYARAPGQQRSADGLRKFDGAHVAKPRQPEFGGH